MSKYHARITEYEGIKFHSAKEARRYQELRLLEKAGEISRLEIQPSYTLYVVRPGNALATGDRLIIHGGVCGVVIGEYRGDFRYWKRGGVEVVEDVKGFRTPLYKWKKRHVEAQYGVQIVEI